MYFLYVNKTEYTCTVCYLPCWAADSCGCLLVLGVCEFWTNQGVVGEGPDVDGCMTCGKRKQHMYRHRAGDTSEDQRRRGCYHGDYRVWVKEVNISEACFKCFCQSHCLNELIADSILVTSSVSTCTTYSGLSWCVNVCRCWKSLKDLRESKWTECYSTRRLYPPGEAQVDPDVHFLLWAFSSVTVPSHLCLWWFLPFPSLIQAFTA